MSDLDRVREALELALAQPESVFPPEQRIAFTLAKAEVATHEKKHAALLTALEEAPFECQEAAFGWVSWSMRTRKPVTENEGYQRHVASCSDCARERRARAAIAQVKEGFDG